MAGTVVTPDQDLFEKKTKQLGYHCDSNFTDFLVLGVTSGMYTLSFKGAWPQFLAIALAKKPEALAAVAGAVADAIELMGGEPLDTRGKIEVA